MIGNGPRAGMVGVENCLKLIEFKSKILRHNAIIDAILEENKISR